MTISEIKTFISAFGFCAEDGKDNIYYKSYPLHDNYKLRVNFNTKKIEYYENDIDENSRIMLGDTTTSNFKSSENFVVLECVNRLLEKGYSPNSLTLEKKSRLGHKEKGKLDINVSDTDGNSYLMIECKTWGSEFTKERNKMLKDGGQLFSYFNAIDRSAKYLCLYSSHLDEANTVIYKSEIVPVDESWHELSSNAEIYEHWNKNFKDNGIFEDAATAYDIEIKALTRGRLQPLTKDDSGKIFNQFAEILRHNVVSDKPNAFNKILNLFICKIIDEDKNDDEQVDFQWLDSDDNYSLQLRLNDLYKEGMNRFLGIDVTDYSEKDIEDELINMPEEEGKNRLLNIFKKLRLQKNPEFAFIEVYDDNSFDLNARVVREVVELLQPYQFRYGHKQQFLGDFFEKLLNTSMKQEAGQFFTPTPIAHYIISCLPIKEFIENRIKKGNTDGILPTVIDYACGTGHFLTEYMDMVQAIIDDIDISSARRSIKPKLEFWRSDGGQYQWANEYVYGVDADYRLIKSSKVSSFLNGDGEANIIRANGLDHFKKSKDYRGKLLLPSTEDSKDNPQFDILIANPPYSVNAFKSTVKYGEESFELFEKLTDSSSEIECLFVERMKQLLKIGGYAGIILPSSILTNSGIYVAAREIILKYFYIVGITEFGPNTFMATNTNTVALFLKRRDNSDWKKIEKAVSAFFDKPKDVTVLGIEKAFTKYVETVFEDITLDDYISFVNRKPTATFKALEVYTDYRNWFDTLSEVSNLKKKKEYKDLTEDKKKEYIEKLFYDKVLPIEQDKLLYFLLTYSQNTVIVKTGEKQAEKDFLGYEFSNTRGHEGIKLYENGTKLYSENERINSERANFYIYHAYNNNIPSIDEQLWDNVLNVRLNSIIDYNLPFFEKVISLNTDNYLEVYEGCKYKLQKLSAITRMIQRGKSPKYGKSDVQIIKSGQARGLSEFDFKEKFFVSEDFDLDNRKLQKGDLLFNSTGVGTAGRVTLFDLDGKFVVDSHITIIRFNDSIRPKYALYIFDMIGFKRLEKMATGQSGQIEISLSTIQELKIPVPPLDIQEIIVNEIEIVENESLKYNGRINELIRKLNKLIDGIESKDYTSIKLRRIAHVNPPKPDKNDYSSDMMISFIEMAAVSEDGFVKDMETKSFSSVLKGGYTSFVDNDIIIAKITPCMENGKCALVTNLMNGVGYGSTEFHVIRADQEQVLPKYLFSLLNREKIRLAAKQRMTGKSGHRRVPESFYADLDIPLPHIDEQKAYVQEIETIEKQINDLNDQIRANNLIKKEILKKYL